MLHLFVMENLADDQCTHAEPGRIVQLRLETDEQPTNESIQTDTELTKKMVVKWDNLEVQKGQCTADSIVLNRLHRRGSVPPTRTTLMPYRHRRWTLRC